MRKIITNFDIPMLGNQLTKDELIVTLAFLLRGNYYSTKAYISLKSCRNFKHAVSVLSKACANLGIPLSNLSSDKDEKRFYSWGQELKLVLAKQKLLPTRYTWKNMLRIPEQWIGQIDKSILIDLLEFIFYVLKNRDAAVKQTACQTRDYYELNRTLTELFKPIAPDIKIEYISDLKCACILGVDEKLINSLRNDDISDLL